MIELPPLQEWLDKNTKEIDEMILFSKTPLDSDPNLLNEKGSEINAMQANAGYMLADVSWYLITEKAKAMRSIPESIIGPTLQKVYVEEKTAGLRRLRDELKVLTVSLKNMAISVCSMRKSSYESTITRGISGKI